jgi:(2R)-3-sulfolactate dehydrogenase (NADP+)
MTSTRIPVADLEALVVQALEASNIRKANAASVARALTQAEIDGQSGHGLSRVATYSAQAKSGKVNGHATPVLKHNRPGSMMIDVKGGFAYPAFDLAIAELPKLATANGIAAAGFVHSHHVGVVGRHVERLAEAGLVALAFSNTPHAMASWGGKRSIFGTNPIGFAAPQRSEPPIVVDLALSHVARGKIMTAAQKGQPIPEGWAVDENGKPTTDAKAALKGTLIPLGGAKGSALALMVEVLAVALTGANFGAEASSFLDAEGPAPGVGQLLIVIDPGAFSGRDVFLERIGALAGMIGDDDGARLPGTRRLALREAAKHGGIDVDDAVLERLRVQAKG